MGSNLLFTRTDLTNPTHWRKPRMIFVNSMSDLFHEQMPLSILQELFGVMGECPRHTFQILTKRHKRLAELVLARWATWSENIWIGVSVENQSYCQCASPLSDHRRTVRCSLSFGGAADQAARAKPWMV